MFEMSSSGQVILNQLLLELIETDMINTMLPTWLAKPPRGMGSAKVGKIKADVWRTFFTISLVITLIRLWDSPTATPHQRKLLDNFLALATAIRFATARTTSERHIQIFEAQIQHYLRTLIELYSPDKLLPNHHATLHLAECIRSFGPAHGWWTFPFERFNGIIQRQNMNNRPGERILPNLVSFLSTLS